jgi:hypothetical protein
MPIIIFMQGESHLISSSIIPGTYVLLFRLLDTNGTIRHTTLNDNTLLVAYYPQDGWTVHVEDVDPNRTIVNLTDTSQV